MKRRLLLPILFLSLSGPALASSTQFGETGLLSEPSAETLNAGNICIGIWGNSSSGEGGDALIVPVSITLGLGTFLEFYGSYPNLLFNDDEGASGRGFVNMGAKIRFWGSRSAPFKLALDGQARRTVADDPALDGLTDYVGRVVASYKPGRFGVHVNTGYSINDSPSALPVEDQIVYGGGIEFYPLQRLRLIAEMSGATERFDGADSPREATLGFQYFISPHLTLNLGFGAGLSDASPDWRGVIGFSSCQGVGTYSKPVTRTIETTPAEAKATATPEKKVKVRALSPLIPSGGTTRMTTPSAVSPVPPLSQFEVPVAADPPAVVVQSSERLAVSEAERQKALPIAPVVSPSGNANVSPPIPPQGVRTTVYRHFRLPEFTFDYNQSDLSAAGKKVLSEIAEQLRKERRPFVLRLEGHTDSLGSKRYNEDLSFKRARAAAAFLAIHNGLDSARLFVNGFGEGQPLAPNLTPEGRSQNRRIEVLVLVPSEEK